MNSFAVSEPFALLDDSTASGDDRRSRLFTDYLGCLSCDGAADFPALLDRMQQRLRAGAHAVGLFSYELGAHMHGIVARDDGSPWAQVLLFGRCTPLSSAEVVDWLAQRDNEPPQAAGILQIAADVDENTFSDAISRIRAYIEAGDTYQVNYTYRLRFDAYGTPLALYRRLRARQPVPYGALIALPDGRAVLSLSPELFVRHRQGWLTAQPMKGTAPATGNAETDAARAAALAADPKNRAENLMIVDLLRNDLGRVAQAGTVTVPKLFAVDRFSSVLQMTSTVQARLRADAHLDDVFRAIYPCGSITGAPKRRTMQIIRELERSPRGLYTGAIGWFEPPRDQRAVGDFCLSVPIRTLMLQAPDERGLRRGEMGVGAGIVHDSDAADEFAECRLKARFLTGLPQTFGLFETMRVDGDGCALLERHLQRLRASAAHFGMPFDEHTALAAVRQASPASVEEGPRRMRLSLQPDGTFDVVSAPLTPLATPVTVLLASQPTHSGNPFLRHKSSMREHYDAAWRAAEEQGAFDMLFRNERGELTEGGRSNLFVKLDGRWYTPPLAAGVLPGVMRSVLLEEWQAQERSLSVDDLRNAEEIVVCNALRGALPATVRF